MRLGEYIEKYRNEHELSARAFSTLSGLSVQYVRNLERGINNNGKLCYPTVATYSKVAKATGVTETELLLMLDDTVTINPELSNREIILVQKFRVADDDIKKTVENVLDGVSLRRKKIIPLFCAAAGPGEPPSQDGFEDYEVDEDSPARFAVKISGDSMEPEFHAGDIVLCHRKRPEIGEIAVMMVDGYIYVKQYITDGVNIYLRSLNRKRKDCDVDLWASGDQRVEGYGTVIHKRIPLVQQ